MLRIYKSVFLIALFVVASPAMAGKDFIKKDMRSDTTELAQAVGAKLSEERLVFVVHGGNKNLMMAAYRVAQRIDDEGIPVAFLLAPDRDTIDITMHVDYWTSGWSKFGLSAYDNDKNTIEGTEKGLYEQAKKAYEYNLAQNLEAPKE